ncbi:hypothetical protein HMPREF9081_2427 [Centipeda periodontii DSM 2778]|uniref:Uncharacterized protein n=2 Tax=Centipeda TaxID=82202 RepID=F5RQ91_9FIRM|nr:hypothetical protein HMPREF9081_2427 [Centipeda periodontii DSM 2778]
MRAEEGDDNGYEEGVSSMSARWEQLLKEEYEHGREQGIEQGREQGEERAYLASIRGVMRKLSLTAEKAMDLLAIPQSEWARYKAML